MHTGEDVSRALDVGGATTTFEERTVWNFTDVSLYGHLPFVFGQFHLFRLGSSVFCLWSRHRSRGLSQFMEPRPSEG